MVPDLMHFPYPEGQCTILPECASEMTLQPWYWKGIAGLYEASFCMVHQATQSFDPMVMGSFSYFLCCEVRARIGAVPCRMTYLWMRHSVSPQAVVFAKTL